MLYYNYRVNHQEPTDRQEAEMEKHTLTPEEREFVANEIADAKSMDTKQLLRSYRLAIRLGAKGDAVSQALVNPLQEEITRRIDGTN